MLGFGFRVLEFRALGLGCWVFWGFGLRVQGFWGLGLRLLGFWGLAFRLGVTWCSGSTKLTSDGVLSAMSKNALQRSFPISLRGFAAILHLARSTSRLSHSLSLHPHLPSAYGTQQFTTSTDRTPILQQHPST